MQQHVLFVFGNQACVPEDPLRAARALGCRVSVIAGRPVCGLDDGLLDHVETVPLHRSAELLSAVEKLHETTPITGILAYDDQAVPVVADLARRLNLPGHPVDSAYAARDKVLMKERFSRAGLPIAAYLLATSEDHAAQWAETNGYPVVVKPVCGSASQGVIRADDELALRDAYRTVTRIVREQGLDTNGRPGSHHLVEGYLHGEEVSVELLVQSNDPQILCVFEKPSPMYGPFFEETIYATPPRVAPELLAEVEHLAFAAVAALGLSNGAAHCEIRLTDQGAFVLECAARLIGGACSRVFRHVLGEDIHTRLIGIATGEKQDPPSVVRGAAGAMMLPIPRKGRLVRIEGVERARSVAGIEDVILNVCAGDPIIPFPDQGCYVGFLTARAGSTAEVAACLSEAASCIDLQLAPLTCETWARSVTDQVGFKPDPRLGIRTLAGLESKAAIDIVRPLIAQTHFPEYPKAIAEMKADSCIEWLVTGNRGATAPDVWLVADDYAVALGSRMGAVCFVSCLGVRSSHTRSGVAEAMIRTLMSIFANRGVHRLEVLLDPAQPSVIGLYRKIGFVKDSLDDAEQANCGQCCAD